MFPCTIARVATIDLISTGMAGIRNGALHVVCFSAVHFSFLWLMNCNSLRSYFVDACGASSSFTIGPCSSVEVPPVLQAAGRGCVGCR